jgi:hypothetical protein
MIKNFNAEAHVYTLIDNTDYLHSYIIGAAGLPSKLFRPSASHQCEGTRK